MSHLPRRYQVEYDEGLDNIVVVDGAPVIDASKKERLVTKICKDFGKKGVHVKADNIFMPWDDKAGKSKGCVSYTVICHLDLIF